MREELSLNNLPESVQHYIQHLERMRQDFVANVSHELRTPLTVIQGYLEALLMQNAEEAQYEPPLKAIFEQMYQHGIRMAGIIDNLLLLSSLENEESALEEPVSVNVPAMLTALLDEARSVSGDKQHHITLAAVPDLFLHGSEHELRSLFSNLIINAVKYTPAHGTIQIEWKHENQQAVFAVSDSGIGIEERHIPRLTERFYRVDKGRSRASGGTGLGLAIAKHVLLRHHGELKVESEIGKGSRFICLFPLARPK